MNETPKSEKCEARWLVEASTSFVGGVLLLTTGLLTALVGFSAMVENELLALAPRWVFRLDGNVWGWIHIVLGILMVAGGFAVMFRLTWARSSAVALGSHRWWSSFCGCRTTRFGRLW